MTIQELLSKNLLGLSGISELCRNIYESLAAIFTSASDSDTDTSNIIEKLDSFVDGAGLELADDGNYYLTIDDTVLIDDGYIIID